MTQTFNCPSCGAPLDYDGGPDFTIRCTFCNNVVIVPESLRTGSAKQAEPAPPETGHQTIGRIPQWAELTALVNDGKKLEAIKLFRELTGAGLKEAKDAVEKIEEGRSFEVENYAVISRQTKLSGSQLSQAMQIKQIGDLIREGKKLEAIKLYREAFDVGLAEAKEAVEKLDSTKDTPGAFDIHPPTVSTRRYVASQPTNSGKTNPLWVIGFIIGLAALIFSCYALSIMDEYDTFDISIVFRGTPTYTPEPTEPPPPTAAPSPTPEPTATPKPDFVRVNILAGCIGTSRRCFEEGRFVGVDGAGNIYVGETTGRIQALDSEGGYITEWHTTGDDEEIDSLAVDRQGTVYAVQGGAIYRYGGVPGEATGDPLGPVEYEAGLGFQSVAVTADGELVAAWNKDWQGGLFTNFSESQDDIVIFDSDGQVVRVISQALSVAAGANPELDTVVGVDSDGNLYASGLLNQGIFKFTSEGKLLDKFGLEELEGVSVAAIAIDEQGRVYVTGGPEMYIYDSKGRLITSADFGVMGLALTDEGALLGMDQYELFELSDLTAP